ncbi:MAG: hypothetical protein WCJ60_02275 [bacterium]
MSDATDNAYKEIIKAYQTTIDQLLAVIEAQSKVIQNVQQPTLSFPLGSRTHIPYVDPNPKMVC